MKHSGNSETVLLHCVSLYPAAKEEAKREAERIKAQQEAELLRKIEAEAKQQAEAARRLAEENAERWAKEETKPADEADYHLTSNVYAKQAEDEVDAREERGGRRTAKKAPAACRSTP